MSIKIEIKEGEKKPHWISLEDFKKLLFDEEITTKGMPLAYPDKVKSFFDQVVRTQSIISIWQEAYPNVDIESELNLAKAWLLSNTGNAKKDFKKFCNNWLARAMKNPNKTAVVKSRHEQSNEHLYKQKKKWDKETPASQKEIKTILKELRGQKT